jgi:hypothetical protein
MKYLIVKPHLVFCPPHLSFLSSFLSVENFIIISKIRYTYRISFQTLNTLKQIQMKISKTIIYYTTQHNIIKLKTTIMKTKNKFHYYIIIID